MKKRIYLKFLLVLGFVLVFNMISKAEILDVHTDPIGATIYVDNSKIGDTTEEGLITDVDVGKHLILAKKSGYDDASIVFDIKPEKNSFIKFHLEKIRSGGIFNIDQPSIYQSPPRNYDYILIGSVIILSILVLIMLYITRINKPSSKTMLKKIKKSNRK